MHAIHIPDVILTTAIIITGMIMLEVTTAATPLAAIPMANTRTGFPTAVAYFLYRLYYHIPDHASMNVSLLRAKYSQKII